MITIYKYMKSVNAKAGQELLSKQGYS